MISFRRVALAGLRLLIRLFLRKVFVSSVMAVLFLRTQQKLKDNTQTKRGSLYIKIFDYPVSFYNNHVKHAPARGVGLFGLDSDDRR